MLTFSEKFPSGKNVQKWPKNESFGLFRKICSLVLSGNSAEWKYLLPFNNLKLWLENALSQSDFSIL